MEKIILRFGMPLVIQSDQGREFELHLCSLLGCTRTRSAPYHPESDGMIERFNQSCLVMLSMFVNDRHNNWHELLPYVMHAYRTSVHELTGYSPFRLMMGEECSLPVYHRTFPLLNFALTGSRTLHHTRSLLGSGTHWRLPMTMSENHYVEQRPGGSGCTILRQ